MQVGDHLHLFWQLKKAAAESLKIISCLQQFFA